MIDLVTGNKMLECPLGFYDPAADIFLVVKQISDISDITDESNIMVLSYEDDIRDNTVYEILNEFTAQQLADSLSIQVKEVNKAALDRKYTEENK